jgi:hypothetical protein
LERRTRDFNFIGISEGRGGFIDCIAAALLSSAELWGHFDFIPVFAEKCWLDSTARRYD